MESDQLKPFNNTVILPENLIPIESIDFNGLSSGYRIYFLVLIAILGGGAVCGALILAKVAQVRVFDDNLVWIIVSINCLMAIISIFSFLSFPTKGYLLREHELSFQGGVLIFKRTSIPYCRIQHVETSQHLLEKLFGLTRLKLYTAGGSMSDLTIPGLKTELANQIEATLMDKSGLHV